MRKDFQGLLDALKGSATEIMNSDAADRGALLTKSFEQFEKAFGGQLVTVFGPEPTVLEKGLNHISAWASAVNRLNQTAQALKTGRPSYMIDSDSSMPAEVLPPDIAEDIDRGVQACVLALRSMVNNSIELPEDEDDLQRAEAAGTLFKMEGEFTGEMLLKSSLPEDLAQWIDDPVSLMIDAIELGRAFLDRATADAEPLMKIIPDEVFEAYPEVFDLAKEFPPPKKKKPAAGAADDGTGGSDEAAGDGAADQGDGTDTVDTGAGGMPGAGDEVPDDPFALLAKLGTMVTIIATSLGQGAAGQPGQNIGVDPNAADVGLQRSEPISLIPLAKILGGEVEVDPTLADALDELLELREKLPELEKALGGKTTEFETLKATFDNLNKTLAPARGVVKQLAAVTKADDGPHGGDGERMEKDEKALEEMNKRSPDGSEAARFLISRVHQGGGRPYAPAPVGATE